METTEPQSQQCDERTGHDERADDEREEERVVVGHVAGPELLGDLRDLWRSHCHEDDGQRDMRADQ